MYYYSLLDYKVQPAITFSQCVGYPNATPPPWMSVPHARNCLGSKKVGLTRKYCLPSVKPFYGCPDASWVKLNEVFEGKC